MVNLSMSSSVRLVVRTAAGEIAAHVHPPQSGMGGEERPGQERDESRATHRFDRRQHTLGTEQTIDRP